MSNRTAKFVSAIFAGFLAGAAVTISHGAAHAADEAKTADKADNCLAGPKGQTPAGAHWYYRIDRPTKRHCWYLGEARERVPQVARQESAPSARPSARAVKANPAASNSVPAQREAATQRTIADAYAELPLPQTRIEPTGTATGQWPAAAAATAAANTADEDNSQQANAPQTDTQSSLIATRWPESSGVSSSASADPAAANSGANDAQPNFRAAQASVVPPPPSAVAAVPLAAADSSSESQAGSLQMLLIVIAGALALASFIAAAVFKFGSMRQAARREMRGSRRVIWDAVDAGPPSPAPFARADAPVRVLDIPREPREAADDPSRRIAEMLAQLHRSGAN